MKKIFFCALALGSAAFANAQTFKPFKVDFATGYAIPSGSGSKGGVLFAVEPKYAINDNIALGLRMEAAVTARAAFDETTDEWVSGDVKASGSYLATGDYYFNTNKFRPFAGIGAGLFRLASVQFDSEDGEIKSGNKFGFAPRAGFEFGHFRAALEYNVVGKSDNIKNSYIGIKVGFFAGGGRLAD